MLVTFYILAYNHADIIADAINAALAQTYSPLQIIVSDDCSTDSTWEVIQNTVSLYEGPHKVEIRRNVVNLGISVHINTLWKECSGEWIVASAGDDTSLPIRVEAIVAVIKNNPNIKLVQSWLNEVDENDGLLGINRLGVEVDDKKGVLFSVDDRLASKSYSSHGAAMAYSRELIDLFDPLPESVIFEDNIMNVRSELLGVTMLLPIALVNHKNHAGQITRTEATISSKKREIRRTLRLTSDVSSANQNLKDIIKSKILNKGQREALTNFYLKVLSNAQKKRIAIIGQWPFKLISLCKLVYKNSKNIPSNDDLMRSAMPYTFYRIMRKFRGSNVNKS